MIDNLTAINHSLLKDSQGFLKVSISLTTKAAISTIEPGTASYVDRLRNLALLRDAGIFTSINLKPILPSTPLNEYLEIVDDTKKFTKFFLLGGLYIDPSTAFGKSIMSVYRDKLVYRHVEWLPDRPSWLYLEDMSHLNSIKRYLDTVGAHSFDSDREVIMAIRDARLKQSSFDVPHDKRFDASIAAHLNNV